MKFIKLTQKIHWDVIELTENFFGKLRWKCDIKPELLSWLRENCGAMVVFMFGRDYYIFFLYKSDAVQFKLAWC